MTSPLPAQHSKPALGESKNSLQGGLLNFCAPPKNSETPSFESLISQNDQRQDRQDELEEAEAAKKRKKAQDAAAIAAQAANSGNIQTEACLDLTQDPLQLQKGESAQLISQDHISSKLLDAQRQADTSKAFENSTVLESDPANLTKDLSKIESIEAQKPNKEEAPPALENSDVKSTLEQEEEAKETAVSTLEDSKDSSSGMKSATFEGDMVSLTTFEDIQASSAPAAVSEPSITSANRLSAMAGLSERTAIRSIENTGSGADNSSGNFSTGNPALIPISGNSALQKNAASQASSLFRSLAPEIEKFQQTGQSQVQLELPVGDNESVKIRLSLRAGEIRSTFITESPELREALQKAWPDFTATHRAQGIRFGESQFQDSFARNQDAASEQGRQRQYQPDSSNFPASPNQSANKNRHPAIIPASTSISTKAGSVNLWA
jgi:flagellar hook-length control protein FliK